MSLTSDALLEASLADGADPQAVLRRLVEAVPLTRIELRRPTLEDVFIRIVQGDHAGDEDALRASVRAEDAPTEATG